MALYDDEDDDYPPPPNIPPGGGQEPPAGNNLPPGNPGNQPPPPGIPPGPPTPYGGGGMQLPGYPTIRIPGAPEFRFNPFRAPTQQDAQNEPGYQFRLGSGRDALERSAAARGLLRTGGTLQNLIEYGQNFGEQEYKNTYDRALAAYDRYYRGEYDRFAPLLQQWAMRAGGDKELQLARYNAELQKFLQDNAPRGGGPSLEDELPPLPPPPGVHGGPGGYQEFGYGRDRGFEEEYY